jgi:hypothetical protein
MLCEFKLQGAINRHAGMASDARKIRPTKEARKDVYVRPVLEGNIKNRVLTPVFLV